MLIYVFNRYLERVGILNSFISITWQEYYRNVGTISITADDTTDNIKLLKNGNVIYRPGIDTAMFISYVKHDTASRRITANGCTTLDLLSQRAIIDPINIINAEQGMYELVNSNIRGLSNVRTAAVTGFEDVYETEAIGGLTDELVRIAAETDLGLKMALDARERAHIFTVYRGVDRSWGQYQNVTAAFSDELKNLYDLTIVNDDSLYYNVAYVAAEDRDGNRRVVTVGDTESTGLDRHELFIKANSRPDRDETLESDSFTQKLITIGKDELNKRLKIQSFNALVDTRDYRIKYNLGDLVTCKSKRYGFRFDARIMHSKEVAERNKTTVTLTFGDPEYTIIEEMILNARAEFSA